MSLFLRQFYLFSRFVSDALEKNEGARAMGKDVPENKDLFKDQDSIEVSEGNPVVERGIYIKHLVKWLR